MTTYDRVEELKAAVAEGWVRTQRHPRLPLTIYNYTPKAVYARHWPQVVREARGLILDDSYTVVARPFEKFFNIEEELAAGTPIPGPDVRRTVYEKADGFLLIATQYNGVRVLATRGSFTSPQCLAATHWLEARAPNWVPEPHLTQLFEGTFKEFRIVVEYPVDTLIHLGSIVNATGQFCPPYANWVGWASSRAGVYSACGDNVAPQDILESRNTFWKQNDDNREGYVVFWHENPFSERPIRGFRVKLKLPQYVAKHRAKFHTTPHVIWEHVVAGLQLKPTTELIGALPQDRQEEVFDFIQYLQSRHREVSTALVGAIRTIIGVLHMEMTPAERAHVVISMAEVLAPEAGLPLKFIQSMTFAWLKAPEADSTIERMNHAVWKLLEPVKGDTF